MFPCIVPATRGVEIVRCLLFLTGATTPPSRTMCCGVVVNDVQVPFVGFNVVKQAECMASHGVFIGIQACFCFLCTFCGSTYYLSVNSCW